MTDKEFKALRKQAKAARLTCQRLSDAAKKQIRAGVRLAREQIIDQYEAQVRLRDIGAKLDLEARRLLIAHPNAKALAELNERGDAVQKESNRVDRLFAALMDAAENDETLQ